MRPRRTLNNTHQRFERPPIQDSVNCKCTKARNCETRRCGCSKCSYGCSSTCGCKGKCGNPLNDEFITEVFNVPESEKTKLGCLRPTDCFIQWFSRTRKTHPERASLDWIFTRIHHSLTNSELPEYYPDGLKDWVKRWNELLAKGPMRNYYATRELKLELIRLGCGTESMRWVSWCKGHWEGSWVDDNCIWHCKVCKTCNHWKEWHCDDCKKCTYGVSLPCENCGGISEVASHMISYVD